MLPIPLIRGVGCSGEFGEFECSHEHEGGEVTDIFARIHDFVKDILVSLLGKTALFASGCVISEAITEDLRTVVKSISERLMDTL